MTNNSVLGKGLQRRCRGNHVHVQCRGDLCRNTENYTGKLARRVHELFKLSGGPGNVSGGGSIKVAPAPCIFGSSANKAFSSLLPVRKPLSCTGIVGAKFPTLSRGAGVVCAFPSKSSIGI
eukprot:11280929-Prorocentrum_lima.AAC.1